MCHYPHVLSKYAKAGADVGEVEDLNVTGLTIGNWLAVLGGNDSALHPRGPNEFAGCFCGVIRLARELAHTVLSADVIGLKAKAGPQRLMKLGASEGARLVFVAAGFHHARTGGKFDPQVSRHQMVEEMH